MGFFFFLVLVEGLKVEVRVIFFIIWVNDRLLGRICKNDVKK